MIFNCRVVPGVFSEGVITHVPKKGKYKSSCSSYRPLTVLPILCKLFELLVTDDIIKLVPNQTISLVSKRVLAENISIQLLQMFW